MNLIASFVVHVVFMHYTIYKFLCKFVLFLQVLGSLHVDPSLSLPLERDFL
jgi:hypothetical protein